MDNCTIPKKIHYIWFGKNPKSELILRCIDSWRRFFPDYEIIEWNEDNYDVNKCAYVREAYECKKWAFASDYARFDILYQHGGIYLDTDVEFLKPLPEDFLRHEAFTGFESSGNIAPGLIYASVQGFSLNREIRDFYQTVHFIHDGKSTYKTVNMVVGQILEKHVLLQKNEFQMVNGLAIYPAEFFCGYNLDVEEYDIRPETISVHHYAGTWTDTNVKIWIKKMVKRMFGLNGYRRLLYLKRRMFGICGAKM